MLMQLVTHLGRLSLAGDCAGMARLQIAWLAAIGLCGYTQEVAFTGEGYVLLALQHHTIS